MATRREDHEEALESSVEGSENSVSAFIAMTACSMVLLMMLSA